MGRPPGAKNYQSESFFDRGWWAGAAIRLQNVFPKAVKVTFREPGSREKKISSAMLVKSWEVDYLFLCEKIGSPCHTFNPGRVIKDKKIVLLYCLYHQRMTAQAIQIAEESDLVFAALAVLEEREVLAVCF